MAAFNAEELEAPSFHFSRQQSTAKRVIRVPTYSDLAGYVASQFPPNIANNPALDAAFPQPGLEWLYIDSIDVEQMSDLLDGNTPPNPKSGWKLTLNYLGKPYLSEGGNSDLPANGTGDGPGSNNQQDQGQMMSYEVDVGGHFLTYPSTAVKWVSDGTQNTNPEVKPGLVQLTLEHTVTWHNVPIPPWGAVRRCAGCVNSNVFVGAAIGHLLFGGVTGSREFSSGGSPTWTLKYKFSELNGPTYTNISSTVYSSLGTPGGWNYFLRPNTSPPTFDALTTASLGGGIITPIYALQDFTNLFVPGGT